MFQALNRNPSQFDTLQEYGGIYLQPQYWDYPITGLTPAKFLREIQLQAARKSLEDGKWVSVSDLAYQFGFKQLSTFSALFKKRFGKNPSEYRGGII